MYIEIVSLCNIYIFKCMDTPCILIWCLVYIYVSIHKYMNIHYKYMFTFICICHIIEMVSLLHVYGTWICACTMFADMVFPMSIYVFIYKYINAYICICHVVVERRQHEHKNGWHDFIKNISWQVSHPLTCDQMVIPSYREPHLCNPPRKNQSTWCLLSTTTISGWIRRQRCTHFPISHQVSTRAIVTCMSARMCSDRGVQMYMNTVSDDQSPLVVISSRDAPYMAKKVHPPQWGEYDE